MYRKTANVGDGGTAAKLVDEFLNGEPLVHLQKAQDMVKYLQRILTEQSLTAEETTLTYKLLNDLYEAIKTVTK